MSLLPFRVVETPGAILHPCGCVHVPDRGWGSGMRASVRCAGHIGRKPRGAA